MIASGTAVPISAEPTSLIVPSPPHDHDEPRSRTQRACGKLARVTTPLGHGNADGFAARGQRRPRELHAPGIPVAPRAAGDRIDDDGEQWENV